MAWTRMASRLEPVDGHQLGVSSKLEEFSLVQHENSVSPLQSAEPMGDYKGRAARDSVINRFEDFVFRLRINGGCRVVEEDDRRLQKEGAGNGEALSLPAGKVGPRSR